MLAHQGLWPPRKLKGKAGILDLFQHLGSIQYDTINVVGRNADLVLQSRIRNYRPKLLEELLYSERLLVDGWDKMASIYPDNDWPYFARRRKLNGNYYRDRSQAAAEFAPKILSAIQDQGPLSSIDIKSTEKIIWTWGNETGLARAAMEMLYSAGKLGIHHKVGTRRVFDLSNRLLNGAILEAPDPNTSDDLYQDWHMLRRIGSLGLAHPGAGEHWLGIVGAKSEERRESLGRLVEKGNILAFGVEDLPKETFFLRTEDLPTLEKVKRGRQPKAKAAFIGPLDNLMWDRKTIKKLFGFEYIWEVYKPIAQREYGYYVLPVLYGDRFVARIDAKFDRKTGNLRIENWWWEEWIEPDDNMEAALSRCLKEFGKYLGSKKIVLGSKIARKKSMQWAKISGGQ